MMWKRCLAIALVCISLVLTGCGSGTAGLKPYVDDVDGYEFLYPNGWVPIPVNDGPDVVFRDLIEETELVSVVVSELKGTQTQLTDLGTAQEVGDRLAKTVLAPDGSNRQAELLSAQTGTLNDKTYYKLEYYVNLPNAERHNLASVAVSRGKLFTLSISAPQDHWERLKDTFEGVVNSFSVY